MTIAAGFKVQDGILLCADTQYTGSAKVYQPKIFDLPPAQDNASSFAFALAGHEVNSRMAIEDCIDALRSCPEAKRSLPRVRSLLRSSVKTIWDAYVETKTDAADKEQARFELVIGAWLPLAGGLRLFRSNSGGLISGDNYYCVGIGAYLGDYIIRPVFTSRLSLEDIVIVATHALASAKAYDANCGGASQFIRILPGGEVSEIGDYAIANLEAFINRYQTTMGGLVLGAANQTLDDATFERHITVFTKTITALRKSWLSSENPLQQLTLLEELAYAIKPLAKIKERAERLDPGSTIRDPKSQPPSPESPEGSDES